MRMLSSGERWQKYQSHMSLCGPQQQQLIWAWVGDDNVMEWVSFGGGKVQLFISHPHIQNKSTKRSEHEMDMIRKSAAAAKLKHCCLVKIPVRIFSLPRHLPAKKFFLHFSSFLLCFFWLLQQVRISRVFLHTVESTNWKEEAPTTASASVQPQKTNSSKEVKRAGEEIMFKKAQIFSVWLLSSDKKHTFARLTLCVVLCVRFSLLLWRIKSYRTTAVTTLYVKRWDVKTWIDKKYIGFVWLTHSNQRQCRIKGNSLTTWNLNICFVFFAAALSMYQNVMTLSLYQTSLLAWDDAWMGKGWNSLLNNPDTTKKHPLHTPDRKRECGMEFMQKYLLSTWS